jgi:xylulokinase
MRLFDGAKLAKELILGLDFGTSSVKGIFIDFEGTILKRVESKIETKHSLGTHAEQDAFDYLIALRGISSKNSNLISRVVSIGLSGQTPSVICADKNGEPVRPVLIWQDNRAVAEAEELERKFGNPLSVIGTSLPWSASACPAKLLWLSRHEEQTVRDTQWIFQPKDFVGFHLTGKPISDPWSSKGLCNVQTRTAVTELLGYTGWSDSVMPELLDGFQSRGTVTKQAADSFGFSEGVEVSVGWSDAMCGMAAMGVFSKPATFVITGTSAIVGSSSNAPPGDGGGLYIIPDTCAPLAVTYGPTQSSGSSIAWAAELFEIDANELIDLAMDATLADTPIYLPYINGERAPLWRPDVQAGFYGVTSECKKSNMALAVMEGISFAERQVAGLAETLNQVRQPSILLGGHAGNDHRWEKIRHRTLSRTIERFEDIDTTTRGSAILAHAVVTKNFSASCKALSFQPLVSQPSSNDLRYSDTKFNEFLAAQEYAIDLANRKRKSTDDN